MIYPNAIAWVNFRLHGSWAKHLAIVATYTAAIIGGIILTDFADPRSSPLRWWPGLLMGIQGFMLLYLCGISVSRAIRRDIDGRIIDSHRLMPLSHNAAVFGYLIGGPAVILEFCIVNFIIGGVCVAQTTGDYSSWILSNLILAVGGSLMSSLVACFAFVMKNATAIVTVLLFIALPAAGPGLMLLENCPPLRVLIHPVLTLAERGGHPSTSTFLSLSLVLQVLFAAIFFRGAVRRYRQDDVPPIGTALSFWLLGIWVLTSVVGLVTPEESMFRRWRDEGPELATLAVVSLVSAMLVALTSISSAARDAAEWSRTTAAIGQNTHRRPINPAVLALLAGAMICAMVAAAWPQWLGHSITPPMRKAAPILLQTFIIVSSFLLSTSYLLRIAFRGARFKPIGVIIIWTVLTWLVPLLADFAEWDGSMPPAASLLSPPACLAEIWRFKHRTDAIWIGIIGQFALMLATAILFHATNRKVRRPLPAAL